MLQKSGVADECRVEGGSGDVEAGIAVEEAEPEDISSDKSPERSEGGLGRYPARLFLKARFKIKIGEVVDLRDIAGNRGIRVVKDIPGQRSNSAFHYQSVVRIGPAPLCLPHTPKPCLPIRIPVPMPNPVAEK